MPLSTRRKLTRSDLLKLVQDRGGSEGLDLSGVDLRGMDLSSDALRVNISRLRKSDTNGLPAWYSASTGGICLKGAIFEGADLEGALLWRGNFTGAIFANAHLAQADLGVSTLTDANFRNARLHRAILARAEVTGADFTGAFLLDVDAVGVNFHQAASLRDIHLAGANLGTATIEPYQLREGLGEENEGDFLQAKEAYLALKNSYLTRGRYGDASWAYIKERQMERKATSPPCVWRFYRSRELPNHGITLWFLAVPFFVRHTARWIFDWFAELFCGYGERPLRAIGFAALIILAFATIYFLTAGLARGSGDEITWLMCLEYSAASFTTTSVPGIVAVTDLAILLTSFEAFLGIGSLSLLMFTLGNRIAKS